MAVDAGVILGAPAWLWRVYVDHLVRYPTGGWVDKTTGLFRVLSLLLLLPVILLTLFDVTSYIIARTLGIIDETKAATSDRRLEVRSVLADAPPTILISEASSTAGALPDETLPSSFAAGGPALAAARAAEQRLREIAAHPELHASATEAGADAMETRRRAGAPHLGGVPQTPYFFTSGEDPSALALAGAGVFSPASTRPPSPEIERRVYLHGSASGSGSGKDASPSRRSAGTTSWQNTLNSTSSGESFALIEEPEEDDSATIRRRPTAGLLFEQSDS